MYCKQCVLRIALARLVSFQRLHGRCIASRSRCTAITQVHALRWRADSFQRLPTRCIASNVCICTALARLVSFQRLLADALQAGRDARQSFKHMLCAGKLILSSSFLPDVWQAICVYALRWQDQSLPSGFLADALQAKRDAPQSF